jgi:integrase
MAAHDARRRARAGQPGAFPERARLAAPGLRPVGRKLRSHHLQHTTATLLLKALVPLATVQRILRHSDPTITAEVPGTWTSTTCARASNRLSFHAVPRAVSTGS